MNYTWGAICADTNIRLILKTTEQSVIRADTNIRLIVKTTAQIVIRDVISNPPIAELYSLQPDDHVNGSLFVSLTVHKGTRGLLQTWLVFTSRHNLADT